MTLSVNINSSRIKLPIFTVDYNISTSGRPSFKVATDDDIRGWFIKSDSYSTYKTSGAILICSQGVNFDHQNVTYRMIVLEPWKNMDRRRQYRQMALHNPNLIKNLDIESLRQEYEGVFDIEQTVKQIMSKQTMRQQSRTHLLNNCTVTVPGSSWLVTVLNTTQFDHLPGVIEFKKTFIENCKQLFPNFIGSSSESKGILSRIAITNQKFNHFEQIINYSSNPPISPMTNHILFPQGIDGNYNSVELGARPDGRTQKLKTYQPVLHYHNQLSCICCQNICFTDPIRCMSDMILVLGLLYDGFDLLFNTIEYRSSYSKAKFIYEDAQGTTILHQLTGERPPDKSFDLLYVMNLYSIIAKTTMKTPHNQSKKIQRLPPMNPGYIMPSAPPLPVPQRQKSLQRRAKLERFLDNADNYEFTNPQRIRQLEKQLQQLRKL